MHSSNLIIHTACIDGGEGGGVRVWDDVFCFLCRSLVRGRTEI